MNIKNESIKETIAPKQIIKPVVPNFVESHDIESEVSQEYIGDPVISLYQNRTHYNGHYLKYINKFNELIETDKTLKKINKLIESKFLKEQRILLLLAGIKMFDEKTPVYRNSSQIYNHELYWNTITNLVNSTQELSNNFNKLFKSQEEYKNLYDKFIKEGIAQFGSGWLWIYYDVPNNKLDVFTTHDSHVPFDNDDMKILGVIDLWEHAYYLDYQADRKKYLEESFKTINWKKLLYNNI